MDKFRDDLSAAFERELDRRKPAPTFRSEVVHHTMVRAMGAKSPSATWVIATGGAVLMIAMVGGFFFAMRSSRQPTPNSPPAASATVIPSPNLPCRPKAQAGCLSVTPTRGAIGTTVVLDGVGCSYPGQPAYLVFEGQPFPPDSGTVGASDMASIPTDTNAHFRIRDHIP